MFSDPPGAGLMEKVIVHWITVGIVAVVRRLEPIGNHEKHL
jgi:hypothetical protein